MWPQFRPASDRSLLICFGERITFEAHQSLRKLLRLLELEPIPGIRNLHPAYCSLLITFDALNWKHGELQAVLQRHLDRLEDVPLSEPQLVEIPVSYGGDYGPDLCDVAAIHGITPARVIELHASVTYTVYFLGFVPGFAYLGDLPKEIAAPRLQTPRLSVPAGSVGIAGNQTGVYPFTTPGGWRLIGCTPLAMFRPDRAGMSLLRIGDHVRFTLISPDEFKMVKGAPNAGAAPPK